MGSMSVLKYGIDVPYNEITSPNALWRFICDSGTHYAKINEHKITEALRKGGLVAKESSARGFCVAHMGPLLLLWVLVIQLIGCSLLKD